VTAALAAGGLIAAFFSLHLNGDLYLAQVNFWRLGVNTLLTAYSLLPYVAITFVLAVATRSAVAAIGGCTAYGLIVESLLAQSLLLLPGGWSALARYLPTNLMQSVLSASWTPPALMEESIPGLLSPAHAVVCIALWTLLLFSVALWIFKRQDFSG
jgi:ABC-type transport system involved in multi-copper enzyme maturation permease subunit